MPIDKYIVTRISLDARDKLAKLSKEKGISNAEIIDYILGLDQAQGNKVDVDSPYSSLMKSKGWIIDAQAFIQSKIDAGELLSLADIKLLTNQRLKSVLRKKGVTTRSKDRPPKAVLESAILMLWKSSPKSQKGRKEILKDVTTKMEKGWGNLYPSWYKNHADYLSTFEITVDNRIKNLIKDGILERGEQQGTYQLARTLSKDEWDTVTGVNKLPAQKGLVIKSILPAKSKCDVCGKYKESIQGNKCGECLNIYNPIFSLTYLFPYI